MQPIVHMGAARARGFSLLEVLVAFSILALSLGVLMQIFSGGLRNVEVSTQHARAVTLARSLMARIGTELPLAPGEPGGEFRPAGDDPNGEVYRWQIRLRPMEDPVDASQPVVISLFGLMAIAVRVEWADGPHTRDLTLYSTKIYTKTP